MVSKVNCVGGWNDLFCSRALAVVVISEASSWSVCSCPKPLAAVDSSTLGGGVRFNTNHLVDEMYHALIDSCPKPLAAF